VGVTTLGYLLGETVPDIDKYLLPVIALIVFVSVLPVGIEVLRNRRRNQREQNSLVVPDPNNSCQAPRESEG
jgi:membrane-associated protein